MRTLLEDVMTGRKTQLAASGLAPSAASTGQQGSAASVQQQTLQQLQVLACFPLLGLCDNFCVFCLTSHPQILLDMFWLGPRAYVC